MRIVTIVGARPQFIKAWPVSKALREAGHEEFLLHTGQHYDYTMSKIFFEELDIPTPNVNLEVGSDTQGRQTGQMLEKIESVLLKENPDWVLVYGDTNSTLAGALAAVKLHLRVAHVEAGLRSFNRQMPEEHNRVLTDHCADLLMCPTATAVDNLKREGIENGVHLTGDVMLDALLEAKQIAQKRSRILDELGIEEKGFLLATLHRAENTDAPQRLKSIMQALQELARYQPVIFPVHPRTRKALESIDVNLSPKSSLPTLTYIPPVGYLDMLRLEESARVVVTDSGGVQKEAFWLRTPCVTLRDETEWSETITHGWNHLAGANTGSIVAFVKRAAKGRSINDFGAGNSSERIVQLIMASN